MTIGTKIYTQCVIRIYRKIVDSWNSENKIELNRRKDWFFFYNFQYNVLLA